MIGARDKIWQTFLQQDLPAKKHERWRYADLTFLHQHSAVTAQQKHGNALLSAIHQHRLQHSASILLVFVNGYYMPLLSETAKLPEGVIACRYADAKQHYPDLIAAAAAQQYDVAQHPFAKLNAALGAEGLFFYLPDNCELTLPLHLLSIVLDDQAFTACPEHLFLLGAGSKLIMLEEYFSRAEQAYLMNIVTHIFAGNAAELTHYKIQQEGKNATHIAHTFVQQKENSRVHSIYFSCGAHLARDEIVLQLQEAGAHCKSHGFYHLQQDQQYVDFHIDVKHEGAGSQSEMLFKGILQNKSRAVFNGRVHVSQGAQKITAYQGNHHLLLSAEAEAYAKPELEIYADDVQCKHGASCGQLDEDALFYLRARGIAQDEAIALLLQGFAEDIFQRILHPYIRTHVQERI